MSVYLIGAGPGDPDLVTRGAARVLAEADVVVHDRLIGPGILELANPRARLIDVGKTPGESHRQDLISQTLIDLAARHDVVVRLKGGDPFVFGRGAEEARALADAGIDVVVVPGLSSALAAPALAGISLTQRGVARGVCVVTATGEDGEPVDLRGVAHPEITLVILMGVAARARIVDELRDAGLDEETPVCVVERAGWPSQRVVRTVLSDLVSLEVSAPAVIVVGAAAGVDLGLAQRALVGASGA